MPIYQSLKLQNVSDQVFAEIDSAVMACSYATQNRFGCLFDEQVYENDLAARLRAEGLIVHTQVPLKLSFGGFEKSFYLDLVVNEMVYELKVVASLVGEHDAQALNYAMLQNIRLVKLINFGKATVQGRLLRNALLNDDRYRPAIDTTGYKPLGTRCDELTAHLRSLIQDWGTHLNCRLYNDALVHQFGGEINCRHRLEVIADGVRRGTHGVQQHDQNHSFVVTGFTKLQENYHQHLRVLLRHIPSINGVQWINFNHSRVEVTTIGPETESSSPHERLSAAPPQSNH
jgi:GxxExxY protein